MFEWIYIFTGLLVIKKFICLKLQENKSFNDIFKLQILNHSSSYLLQLDNTIVKGTLSLKH